MELPGQFSVRGGIVDIYSLTEENPWRIELWGDEVDSIRSFDVESQRSLENLDEIAIYPAVEMDGEIWYLFWIIFRRRKMLLFLDEPNRTWKTAGRGGRVPQSRSTERKKAKKIFRSSGFVTFEGSERS